MLQTIPDWCKVFKHITHDWYLSQISQIVSSKTSMAGQVWVYDALRESNQTIQTITSHQHYHCWFKCKQLIYTNSISESKTSEMKCNNKSEQIHSRANANGRLQPCNIWSQKKIYSRNIWLTSVLWSGVMKHNKHKFSIMALMTTSIYS